MGQCQTKNKKIKSMREPKFCAREEYFIKNGGILLEKQIALSHGRDNGAGHLKILSHKDIEKATHNFDPCLLVGSSTHRNVYEGTIEDRRVAIKASPPLLEPNLKLIDRCSTEAATAFVMNHKNMAKLYGCCLETLIPVLVFEFMPNRSLFEHLHTDISSTKRIQWTDRLKVATDIAYALSYMHTALSKPVVHRDINSYIILLDYSFHAELSNFGCSVPITPGDKSQRWPVEGTPGYIDPVYIETQVVTDKSDVYSFGVLILELLTRREPRKMARCGTNLVDVIVTAVEENYLMQMIDSEILEQACRGEIQVVAQLALTCVSRNRSERPTMIEVVQELWQIQGCNSK